MRGGDRLLLYTDGVTECRGGAGDLLGTEGLLELASRLPAGAEPWPSLILDALRRYHQDGFFQDDVTVLELLVSDR